MKIIVVIPARGGSKGVPLKNIKLLNGKPLIYYTLEAARNIFSDDQIIVSTDNEIIKECVEKFGLKVPFLRPSELATDTSGTHEVLIHALDYVESKGYFPDYIILLQPTSPFRTSNHINEALNFVEESVEMVVSVKETKANPYYLLKEEDDEGWLYPSKYGNFIRRQDCPKVYELNGAIYIINIKALRKIEFHKFTKIVKYVMDEVSSVDIDSIYDFRIANCMMKYFK